MPTQNADHSRREHAAELTAVDCGEVFSEATLAAHLREWAAGDRTVEAAVGLLVAHGSWLRRSDFRTRIWCGKSDEGLSVESSFAGIDWDTAAELLQSAACSTSERRILSIVIALGAGRDHPIDLGEALTGLDAVNATHVLEAVAHAADVDH